MAKLPDHIGLDFGNHSIKAVELSGVASAKPTLVNFGTQQTPFGVLNSDNKDHQDKLVTALKELMNNFKFKNRKVVLALPESLVFTRFIELPGIKDDEILSAVFYEAKQYLPVAIEDVQMSCIRIGYNEEKNAPKVLLIAAPRKIIDLYMDITSKAGLEVVAIETESVAVGRAMYKATNNNHMVMLDFGSNNTDMSIMYEGNLVFSQSISIGSDALTQSIVNQFNLEYAQAEEYKRNYGISQGVLEDKVFNALRPIVDSLLVEVQRGIEFYKSKTLMPSPNQYILTGDGAMLPGLPAYLTSTMNVEAVVGDPWVNINIPEKMVNLISKSKPAFAVAIGLALKDEY